MRACRAENQVPEGYFRTWVERYEIAEGGEVQVDVAAGREASFERDALPAGAARAKAFFVPKLCNHCERSVCSQVCPVGASYQTKDGVVLVDAERCVGCAYCVQACPYGTRFINPLTHTAEKCTLCYHRITRGLKPACVLVCPVRARLFGDLKNPRDPLRRILRQRRYTLLRPELGTHPKCYYLGLDLEVK
ncbi:MAG: 4Fe-4S dicluster domain-containing protein [Deltaproteobacteria bacterium]|nr:4Fe-4S dicluster domain-containing protein [Deltaproteobacteria bacterium]